MNQFYAYTQERVKDIMYRVFGWMAFALTVTGFVAYYVFQNASLKAALVQNQWAFLGIIIAQFVLVIVLSAAIFRLSLLSAFFLFTLYAISMGITLSTIFMVYTTGSIVSTFFVTAGMFGSMALYGAFTKADLTSMGSFLYMALWGVILSMLVNFFIQSSTFDLVLSIVGVVIFAGLSAFDVQKIKQLAQRPELDGGMLSRVALIGALQLYLDFLNLFLSLLRIMGNRKE